MKLKVALFGTLVYTLVTFPLAVVWHVILFEEQYRTFGYFNEEPSFVLGFLTIIIQGFILSFMFTYVNIPGQSISRGLKYSLLVGAFFWTSHVLAFVAKQIVDSSLSFILMESFYLLIQFGVYGILIGLIHGKLQSRV